MINMERVYNKIVRDNIPQIIIAKGETPVVKKLNQKEYKEKLEEKLYEEYEEVIKASKKDRIEELADMIEVIRALGSLEKVSLDEIIRIADEKALKRGAFNDRIFLEKVIEKDK